MSTRPANPGNPPDGEDEARRLRSHWTTVLLSAALFALTFAVFARVLGADFVMWDDNVQLQDNDRLGGLSLDRIVWAFTDLETASRYIPLTLLGWVITYEFFGLNPLGYHLGNLLLHSGSVVLAFLVLRRALRLALRHNDDVSLNVCAALGAALWGLHPMRVEPVAWCTTRTYCQAMFFLLLCIWLYFGWNSNKVGGRSHRLLFAGSLAAYAASMLSYPLGLTVPGILLILDVYPLRIAKIGRHPQSNGALRHCLLQKVPFAVVAVIVLVLGLLARFHESKTYSSPYVPLAEFGVMPRLAQAAYLCVYYLWRPWWPVNLSPVQTDVVFFEWHDWPFLASMLLIPAVTIGLVLLHRRWPAPLALWSIHLIALLPVLGWTEHPHYPADRYSLFQGLLWPAAICGTVYGLSRHSTRMWARRWCTAALAIVSLFLGMRSFRQTAVWQNTVTLFSHVITVLGDDPYRADIHRRLVIYYATLEKPDLQAAEQGLLTALEAAPHDIPSRELLARFWTDQRRFDDAVKLLRDGIALNPESGGLRMNLGRLLHSIRRFPEAIDQFSEVLRLQPDNVDARVSLNDSRKAMGLPPITR